MPKSLKCRSRKPPTLTAWIRTARALARARAAMARIRGDACPEHAAHESENCGAGRSGKSTARWHEGTTRDWECGNPSCGCATATAGATVYRRAEATRSPRVRDIAKAAPSSAPGGTLDRRSIPDQRPALESVRREDGHVERGAAAVPDQLRYDLSRRRRHHQPVTAEAVGEDEPA